MRKIFYILVFLQIFIFVSCDSKMTKIKKVGNVRKVKVPIIAKVNNIPITVEDYNREKAKLPKNLRKLLKNPKKRLQFIQNLIDKELIYEESIKEKINEDPEFKKKLEILKRELMINEFLKRKISESVNVSEKEIEEYYKKHKSEFNNKPMSVVRNEIFGILKKQKEQQLFNKYLEELRSSAKIEINTKELQNLN